MSFISELESIRDDELCQQLEQTSVQDVQRILAQSSLSMRDYLALLSPAGEACIEDMAQCAHRRTVQHFGRTMQLFTPMYMANYCENGCIYCGYSHYSDIHRLKLNVSDIEAEAQNIRSTGLEHILLLTGESYQHSPVSYIKDAIHIVAPLFSSVSIEVYSLTVHEYEQLVKAGLDGMTMFQETYNPILYEQLHPFGPKRDFQKRIDTPEFACQGGVRTVNIGALMGLDDWRLEAYKTGLHARYLMKQYPDVEIAVSTPRIRPCAVGYQPQHPLRDIELVQYILALRIAFPRIGITLSSRESPMMRNHLVKLGVTKMSAGVTTAVGGHTRGEDSNQFDISDNRSVAAMAAMIREQGYQPIFKDWQLL
ncbi:2-iminoacetate synthase ThiH [Veillonella caviae]|uniref:2-iminoacetate synthase ThiH n=1 Tax=Veillonella caviae TaxID=248316 RepID=UPI0023F3BBEF|nr:2-iminoacetate synthase ThiH [Veillonella caviae]MCI6406370.1 2-iminoacetate synthase ThiH [Veillonella caviae]MDY6224934.1 2-iminoacetate synthase ThiH [Veillonella caviae]